ncbi:phage antirepressor KilAC domain-containing protein [Pragia fontium]|uniref:phage antirepressor KilAC domain-containing protein n=1 Tax=Pragia fontium TaxID=82985 RepID=UPI0035A24989
MENQELATKALFHDAVAVAEDAISITQAAKSLNTGRNRLCSFLRCSGYFNKNELFTLAFEILRALEKEDARENRTH